MNWETILLINCAFWIPAGIYLAAMIVKIIGIPRVREGVPAAEAG
jgi:hypothetical protein